MNAASAAARSASAGRTISASAARVGSPACRPEPLPCNAVVSAFKRNTETAATDFNASRLLISIGPPAIPPEPRFHLNRDSARRRKLRLDPLRDDQLRLRRRLAQRLGLGVLRRPPPRLRLLDRRKLDDHEAPWRPVAFHRMRRAAADDEPAAELLEARRHHLPVRLVAHGILDVHLHDDVRAHRVPALRSGARMTRFSMKNSIMRCGLTFECPWSGPTCTSKLLPACWSALINCSELDGCTLLSEVP